MAIAHVCGLAVQGRVKFFLVGVEDGCEYGKAAWCCSCLGSLWLVGREPSEGRDGGPDSWLPLGF